MIVWEKPTGCKKAIYLRDAILPSVPDVERLRDYLVGDGTPMKSKKPTPLEKEVKRLHSCGKAPEIIAIRLGIKMSKILPIIAESVA
jgi:hypothetical protein